MHFLGSHMDSTKIISFQAKTYLSILLLFVGKLAISFTVNSIYIITPEIYPTVIRSTMINFHVCVGCLGSTVAPYLNLLVGIVFRKYYGVFEFFRCRLKGETYWLPLPYMLYGSCAMVASMLFLVIVPETKDFNLKDTFT
jgi:hypothetical protein